MGKKRALLVGINYPGTDHPLSGCVNDVKAMEALLRGHYGFSDIKILTDNQATTKNILDGLENLVANATAGDILFFHYSGHGSQYPDSKFDADEEPDGLDEIICPVDLDWDTKMIRDDDLKRIFDKVPEGVNLTVVLDCCNSGSGLDQDVQYQPLGEADRKIITDHVKGGRYLPPPTDIQHLVEDKSLNFHKSRALTNRDVNKTGLLITGCQAQQTSADAYIDGKYMGACTYMINDVLKSHAYEIDYKTLVEDLNQRMVKYGFTQRPELNGSVSLFRYNFLEQMDSAELPVTEDITVVTAPTQEEEDKKSQNKILLILAAVIIGGLLLAFFA